MLSAHLAPALVAKSIRPSLNLPLGIVLCMLPDVFHFTLVLLGVERLGADERYSHTLLFVFFIAVVVFFIMFLFGGSTMDAAIYAALVLSHFVFDLANRRRMAVTPWGPWIPSLGLHERGFIGGHLISFAIELVLVFGSGIFYAWSVFNGRVQSLLVPAILLGLMLAAELFYFHIYTSAIETGLARLTDRIIEGNEKGRSS